MILDSIVAYKKDEVAALLARGVRPPEGDIAPPRGFARVLSDEGRLAVIAEVKKASPSKGLICPDFDPVAIARSYEDGDAQAISVLTDRPSFQGDLEYLRMVRQSVELPVLRKDFIIHAVQIEEARAYGADAILLIAAILDRYQMRDFMAMANEYGIDSLVEVHDEPEAEEAIAAGARLIGVNNRDLRTFAVDLETTFRLQRLIPESIPLVSESGIRNRADMQRLEEAGVSAVLIGETLMRAPDRVKALRELRGDG